MKVVGYTNTSIDKEGINQSLQGEELIGQLIGVENKIHTSDHRRTIHMQDERKNSIAVTLWGPQADLVPDDIPDNGAQPQIVIITATRLTMFKGNYQLNSTGGTKIYINLNILEVEHFKRDMVDVPLQEIGRIQVTQPESLEEAMTKNRKTITELQQLYMEREENEDLKTTYTCVAKISFIHDEECGWMYTSCNNCKSRVDENQYCNKCQVVPEFPIDRWSIQTQCHFAILYHNQIKITHFNYYRYRLIATIDDGNATMTVGIFDKDVENLIGKPITSMMKIYEQEKGAEKVSKELQQCIGKKCTLKLKVNTKGYIQELTAIKIFHVETDDKIVAKRQGKEVLKQIKKEGEPNKKAKMIG
ncbi:uncharacterized protein [Spinacia oleracea]|uniref:Replication factor A C-terminal domain-containing protein n=1 Tax=Spinacia oleracea TaxID=3562 RepID=A0ABM3R3L4_SPIOL|nr:uncharacterized protein LOC130465464 [Spinacia oleracea]